MPLDQQSNHKASCKHAQVACAGCGLTVPRHELADHQLSCDFILGLYVEEEYGEGRGGKRRAGRWRRTREVAAFMDGGFEEKIKHMSKQVGMLF